MKIPSFFQMVSCALLSGGLLYSSVQQAQPLRATIEVRPLMEAVEVIGICHNPSLSDRPIFYQMVLEREDEAGNSVRTSQGGPGEVKAQDSSVVDVIVVSMANEAKAKVILRIYEMNHEVAADSVSLVQEAEEPQPLGVENFLVPNLELGGMVLDETRTRAGREFYDLFYDQWRAVDLKGDYLIRIEEYPFQLRTTLVKIFLNDMEIFSQGLLPNTGYIESLVPYAVDVARFQVENYEEIQRNLEGEDVQGTGIY